MSYGNFISLPVYTPSLCNFGDFMSAVRNSSRFPDSACWNKILFTRGKTAPRLRDSRFHRNRYARPSDCKLAILFSLVLMHVRDGRLRYRLEIFRASVVDRKFDLRIKKLTISHIYVYTRIYLYIATRSLVNFGIQIHFIRPKNT